MNVPSWIKGVKWYDLQFQIKVHKLSTWAFLKKKTIKCIQKYKHIWIKDHSKAPTKKKKKKPHKCKTHNGESYVEK